MRRIRIICITILTILSFITELTLGYIIGLINNDNKIYENKVIELNPGITRIYYETYI